MVNEKWIRATLWISVPFNFAAAWALLVPGSWLGGLIGLPVDVPLIYAALLSFMIFGFGCVYAWLALRSDIDKSVLAIGAIGKAGVFVVCFSLWFLGEVAGTGVLVASGDLTFAAIWGLWLIRS